MADPYALRDPSLVQSMVALYRHAETLRLAVAAEQHAQAFVAFQSLVEVADRAEGERGVRGAADLAASVSAARGAAVASR